MEKFAFDPPFPIDALMPILDGAARFIHLTNQSRIEMCACSVLAASALSCQGLFDVRWKNRGQSPTGLYIFLEAESGQRKTSNDDIAFSEIRQFNEKQAALARASEAAHESTLSLWDLKKRAVKKLIVKGFTKGQCTAKSEALLAELTSQQPQRRKYAKLLVLNLTPQALAKHLGSVYPYAGIISDEGAAVFSGGALRDLGMLNSLWEAGYWSEDRITRERTELLHSRLTIYIQVQPSIFEDFLERSGAQFHGSGFSSRCLYVRAKPREIKESPQYIDISAEDIENYNSRIREFLNQYAGAFPPQPELLTLSKSASELLAWFSQKVDKESLDGGRFAMMRGAAAKSAENCVRLAVTLHTIEKLRGPISVEVLKNAIRLSAWFLNQHRMRFCPKSQLELDMIELEEFITDKIAPRFAKERSVPGPYLSRRVPRPLRQVDRLWSVLKALESRGKVRVWGHKGGAWHVHLADWFPPPPAEAPKRDQSMRPVFSNRWTTTPRPLEPPLQTEIVRDGYELWPDCYLE